MHVIQKLQERLTGVEAEVKSLDHVRLDLLQERERLLKKGQEDEREKIALNDRIKDLEVCTYLCIYIYILYRER